MGAWAFAFPPVVAAVADEGSRRGRQGSFLFLTQLFFTVLYLADGRVMGPPGPASTKPRLSVMVRLVTEPISGLPHALLRFSRPCLPRFQAG